MDNLLEDKNVLNVSFEVLKILSWLLGAYFVAWGLIRFRNGWITQNKWALFKANLALSLGLLFILFFWKNILWKI
jgi:glucan phosphoethanolaminetransferase (alkaline phosphatase superfamily)